MTPRKARNGPRKQQKFQQSDYESDLYASDVAPAPVRARTNTELNLAVLRRHNPEISQVLNIAQYAVLYSFSASSQQWEKLGVEGTLFVCQLHSEDDIERYSIMILNRRGLDNFETELLYESSVEIAQGYVIIKVDSNVYGIWVFSESPTSSTANVPAIIAQIIQDCAIQAETSQRLAEQRRSAPLQLPSPQPVSVETAQPMGRQFSLRELFGQQREEDSTFSNRAETPHPSSSQFKATADTDFFRSTIRPSHAFEKQPSLQTNNMSKPVKPSGDSASASALLELFRKPGASS